MDRRTLLAGSAALLATGTLGGEATGNPANRMIVPPEEDRHQLTFMQWPASNIVHPDRAFLDLLQQSIADIANSISEFEPVVMLGSEDIHDQARKLLSSKVDMWNVPTEDLWCRDSGPLFARKVDGSLVISHIQFNGWGDKQIHRHDGLIAKRLSKRLGLPLVSSGLIGEAGGVEHDGHGLLMAHESSWLNDNRNPAMALDEIEQHLLAAYGAEKMFWAPGVLGEDITDYHIDSLARFTGPGRVLINLPDRPDMSDPFHLAALETHNRLVAGNLEVDVIPEPNRRRVNSLDFVASYVNYYVCNGGVIAAQFGDTETDAFAINALRKHYPDREIVTLNVDALGEVGGGIHCATQQMPAS